MGRSSDDRKERSGLIEAVKRHGADAVSFQGLESGLSVWRDDPPPAGTGAMLPYREAGYSWIAVGRPLVADEHLSKAASRFSLDARTHGRRAVFFCVEDPESLGDFRRLLIGLQSVFRPPLWDGTLRATPRLREQLRRARAKGVTVREVSPGELAEGTPLRGAVEELQRQWLASRPMEPLGFMVSVELFHQPDEHLYVVAERDGQPVEFLSAVPIPARRGWLLEDMLRGPQAPNGTTELLIDFVLRSSKSKGHWITPGLTPLSGPVAWWLRAASVAARALYDFGGLQRFRARLHPVESRPVWMVWDRGSPVAALLDVHRAFAGGRLVPFVWRSLTRHANGPPWAVAVPLVPWTCVLLGLLVSGQSGLLGFSGGRLAAWIVFDSLMAWGLFSAARRPRVGTLLAFALATAGDAAWSIRHLLRAGFGDHPLAMALRLLSALGPIVGTVALLWAAHTARRTLNSRRLSLTP